MRLASESHGESNRHIGDKRIPARCLPEDPGRS
jgi:hypothetical protein